MQAEDVKFRFLYLSSLPVYFFFVTCALIGICLSQCFHIEHFLASKRAERRRGIVYEKRVRRKRLVTR